MRLTPTLTAGAFAATCTCLLATSVAFAAPPRHVLILRDPELAEPLKLGVPTSDFETFGVGDGYEASCSQTALGALVTNDRPTDFVDFLGTEEAARCGDELKLLSGSAKRLAFSRSGVIKEFANWRLELPDGCVYSLRNTSGYVPIGEEVLDRELRGAARLLTKRSASGCAASEPAYSVIDPSETEYGSIPYATEVS
ncbi:MAG TPA: hypothetical protein VMA83_10515 [Solirubrobacteraceae bacterium]|nr:hypothetical protein [Solirubrobacteraceae bacterium]